jgi:hypothetical protein
VPNERSRVTALLTVVVVALGGCGTSGSSEPSLGPSSLLPTSSPATSRSVVPITSGEPSQSIGSGGAVCSPADIEVTLVSDRTEYRAGEPVSLTATATNTGDSPCNLPTGNCLPQIQIADSVGRVVWDRAATVVVCTFGAPLALAPETMSVQMVVWDGTFCTGRIPESCPGRPVSGGTYKATAEWNGASGWTTIVVAT